jgi:hypothetical protein
MAMEQWLLIPWGVALFVGILFLLRLLGYTGLFLFQKEGETLVVLTQNSQGSVEWVVRSFFFWNWLRGKRSRIICVDAGSSDDTCKILGRLQVKYPFLFLRVSEERDLDALVHREQRENAMVVDLRSLHSGVTGLQGL